MASSRPLVCGRGGACELSEQRAARRDPAQTGDDRDSVTQNACLVRSLEEAGARFDRGRTAGSISSGPRLRLPARGSRILPGFLANRRDGHRGCQYPLRALRRSATAIEEAYGLEFGEFWHCGQEPEEYQEINRECRTIWEAIFVEKLEEFGEHDMACQFLADPAAFDKRSRTRSEVLRRPVGSLAPRRL